MQIEGDLRAHNYLVLREFFSRELCQLLWDYVVLKEAGGQMLAPDSRVPTAPRLYGDPLTETLLAQRQATVEGLAGCPLWPSYSYVRLNKRGDALPRHTDREASELAVTVNVGGDHLWPLWFAGPHGDVSVTLNVGDAAMYRGRELPHWREAYPGDRQTQCMLFYISQDSKAAAKRFDGRLGVGMGWTAAPRT